MGWQLLEGDCLDVLPTLVAGSIGAIVTDPPYGIRFMGKAWDGADIERETAARRANPSAYHDPASINGGYRSVAAEAGRYDQSGKANRAFQEWCEAWGRECLRLLKPGGHLVSFGSPRTFHRMAAGLEDAGFIIKDTICWHFGQGFPKSLNLTEALRKSVPADVRCACARHSTQTVLGSQGDYQSRRRFDGVPPHSEEDTGRVAPPLPVDAPAHSRDDRRADAQDAGQASMFPGGDSAHPSMPDSAHPLEHLAEGCQASGSIPCDTPASTSPAESTAGRKKASHKPDTSHSVGASSDPVSSVPPDSGYSHLPHCTTCGGVLIPEGLGTALKPATEFIVLAQKPLQGTYAANVARHGVGALNIDGCRVATADDTGRTRNTALGLMNDDAWQPRSMASESHEAGRWPTNLLLTHHPDCNGACVPGCPVAVLDAQSGESPSNWRQEKGRGLSDSLVFGSGNMELRGAAGYGDSGGASRFYPTFRFEADDFAFILSQCEICDSKRGIMSVNKEDNSCAHVTTAESHSSPRVEPLATVHGPVQPVGPPEHADSSPSSGTPVPGVVESSGPLPATTPSIALGAVRDRRVEEIARRVKSAGNLCDSCGIAIARSLAAMQQGHDPESILGAVSISEHRRRILIRSLALLAESQESTDTIPTIASLSLWFGYVRLAISESTTPGNGDTFDGSDPLASEVPYRYIAKAARSERERGLQSLRQATPGERTDRKEGSAGLNNPRAGAGRTSAGANLHPTVKPLQLMRWLVRLVCPPGETVLDMFGGSGTTGVAALAEGRNVILIERESAYLPIIRRRLETTQPGLPLGA